MRSRVCAKKNAAQPNAKTRRTKDRKGGYPMSEIAWNNLLTYTLQVGLLIGVAGWIPAALRLRAPKARLLFFQALLAACLLLPAVRPWKSETLAIEAVTTPMHAVAVSGKAVVVRQGIDPREIVVALLALGAIARLGMLAIGMLRLRRYRLRSSPLVGATVLHWNTEADIRLSHEIAGPVTFGFFRPVILLPAGFPEMEPEIRDAVLCHETLHVRRNDWHR